MKNMFRVTAVKASLYHGINPKTAYKTMVSKGFYQPVDPGEIIGVRYTFFTDKYISSEGVRELGAVPELVDNLKPFLGVVVDSRPIKKIPR